jgi:ABC-type multidrug transport system ATPase subunit
MSMLGSHQAAPADDERPSRPDALVVERLTRAFGRKVVLSSVDIALRGGERLAVRGPNGSGKTTLLRCVAGTLTPTEGSVLVHGSAAGSLEARRQVGVSLAHDRSFYMRLTGNENLRFFAHLRLGSLREAARAARSVVAELELEEIAAQRVDRCSTGMVQQLSFARALLGSPTLLVLDEPTRSLDEGAVERLWGAIERRPETAVVLATHSDSDAARCDGHLDL